jgi:hypothetical protein
MPKLSRIWFRLVALIRRILGELWSRPWDEQKALRTLYRTGNAMPNGFGGKCAAVGGTVEFSPPNHPSEVLVLDVQGSNCQIGANPALTEITASYRVDPDASTGRFASVTGGGSFNWAADASETPATVNFAGVGAKCFPSSPIRCYPSSPI